VLCSDTVLAKNLLKPLVKYKKLSITAKILLKRLGEVFKAFLQFLEV